MVARAGIATGDGAVVIMLKEDELSELLFPVRDPDLLPPRKKKARGADAPRSPRTLSGAAQAKQARKVLKAAGHR